MTQETDGNERRGRLPGERSSNACHELRNVISVAMLAAETMKRHRHDDAAFVRAHQQLKDELKKAGQMAATMSDER